MPHSLVKERIEGFARGKAMGITSLGPRKTKQIVTFKSQTGPRGLKKKKRTVTN